MHYIRFLRAPALSRSGKRTLLDLVLAITTDLSDAYLALPHPIEVMIYAEVLPSSASASNHALISCSSASKPLIYVLAGPGQIMWRSGLRVLKPTIDVPAHVQAHLKAGDGVRICASTRSSMSASGVARIMQSLSSSPVSSDKEQREGQVMPAYFALTTGHEKEKGGVDVGIRRLKLDEDVTVEFEEELGESMARHIWDGGVLALSRMAETCLGLSRPREEEGALGCMSRLRDLIAAEPHLSVLELGCGIGVLGIGLAALYPQMRLQGHKCSILLTDLPDAESRARANMARLEPAPGQVELSYEILDWEDGRRGRLGVEARSRRWDLIMLADCTYNLDTLPALVGTLSALHVSNQEHGGGGKRPRTSRLFLGTKNRHESEREVFGMLAGEGWTVLGHEVMALPVLGDAAQTVELYLFEKY